MSCAENTCSGGLDCCEQFAGGFYCKTESQCVVPLWQIIFIPVFLFLAGLIIGLIICCKLCKKDKKRLQIKHYAHEEIRVKPLEERIVTYTTVMDSKYDMRRKE